VFIKLAATVNCKSMRSVRQVLPRAAILIEQLVPIESQLLERVNRTALTTRQKEIAMLSAKGLANAQIARQLNISPHTLKEYFKDIYARLEINSQRQLVERLSD